MRKRSAGTILAAAAGLLLLAGCADGYYLQAVGGHMRLMSQRQDIAAAIAAPETAPEVAARLALVNHLVGYAESRLALPSNGSYASFVEIDRDFVSWNVVAAPELSLVPLEWCFPVAGCVSYRGYFDEADAIEYGNALRAEGYDVYVAGARAYSTLGWFDDPLPSTLLFDPPYALAGTIFHELSHQRVYVAGDATFNESYATAVERIATEMWLAEFGTPELVAEYRRGAERRDQFLALVQGAQGELAELYASGIEDEAMLRAKATIIDELRRDYARLKASWGGFDGLDSWFAEDLNNAKLALVSTYTSRVAAFETLFDQTGRDWAAFHAAAEALAALPREERYAELDRLGS